MRVRTAEMQEKRDTIKAAYFAGLDTLEALAAKMDVKLDTVYKWSYREKWEAQRKNMMPVVRKDLDALRRSADQQIEDVVAEVVRKNRDKLEKYLDKAIEDSSTFQTKIAGFLQESDEEGDGKADLCPRDLKDLTIARERNDAVLRRTAGLDKERSDSGQSAIINLSFHSHRDNETTTARPAKAQVIEAEQVE